MKNKLLILIPAVLVILVAGIGAFLLLTKSATFNLDEQYYGNAELTLISADKLQRLVDDKSSFAVFVSQPACRASADFEKVLQSFIAKYPMKFYEIAFSDLKNLSFAENVRFYPSFLIFEKGKLVDLLEADSDDDAGAYTSLDDFETWFTKQVTLQE